MFVCFLYSTHELCSFQWRESSLKRIVADQVIIGVGLTDPNVKTSLVLNSLPLLPHLSLLEHSVFCFLHIATSCVIY